jgi:hypothetical protein
METEGLFTYSWGPDQWKSMHSITFNYPYNPTREQKEKYYNYFLALGDVLPCCTCRKHYSQQIRDGKYKLTINDLENRDTLTKWLFNFHNSVNERLGYRYDITYDMLQKKYNSYIAKCDFSDEQKKIAFRNIYDVHAPVVRKDILLCLTGYIESLGLNKDKYIENVNYYSSLDRESDAWFERNQLCQEQMKKMRLNGIKSIDEKTGMPTLEELKLMEMTCSLLTKSQLKKILKRLGCKVKKTYRFI